jgi:cysteine desulfurase / selenocysteine lyase
MSVSALKAISDALHSYATRGPSDPFYAKFKEDAGSGARQKLGALLNVRPDSLVFTESATQSINIVANGLKLSRTDEIVTRGGPSEHPSNYLPWAYYARCKHASIVDLPGDLYGQLDPSELDSLLKKKNARLVVVSHVLYSFGSILPVREISRVAHENGSLFFLDASQSVGSIPVDLTAIDPDFAAGTAAKWLCGPLGLAFFYCHERALDALEPLNYGPNSCTYKPDGTFQTLHSNWKLQEGFRNWAYCYGLSAAIDLLNRQGLDAIRKKNLALANLIIDALKAASDYEFLGNPDESLRTSIMPVRVHGKKPIDIVQKLNAEGIVIAEREVGDEKILRISPHFYNDELEAGRVSEALTRPA